MCVPKWLTLAAVLTGTAGLSAQQPPADPKRPTIDPVTVAEFARHKAIFSRYDPDLWWIDHGGVARDGLLRDWTLRGQGLPAFYFDEIPTAGTKEELPRPAAPFAAVIRPSGGAIAPQLTPVQRMEFLCSLLSQLATRFSSFPA